MQPRKLGTGIAAPALLVLSTLGFQCSPALQLDPTTSVQESGSEVLFIGISPVSEAVVWISGTDGTYGRTLDGGVTWEVDTVPGADSLQFRDVHGVDASTAYLLSIGTGEQSRIYKTTDGGQRWTLQFVNTEPQGFFDCMGFWDANSGMAFSDSFDGAFYLIITDDGGDNWTRVSAESLPPAREGEGSFAASGHCLLVGGDSTAWIGTGAMPDGSARVLKTTNRGHDWTVVDTPIPGGPMRGITSVAFTGVTHGAVLGGDVMDMESTEANVAWTDDGGSTWAMHSRPGFPGPVYGAVYIPEAPTPTLVAVGPEGIGLSTQPYESWITLSRENHWSVAFASPAVGWAIGTEGRITRLSLYK